LCGIIIYQGGNQNEDDIFDAPKHIKYIAGGQEMIPAETVRQKIENYSNKGEENKEGD
jgi:phage terminase Nu1 subunit (DNA packaging protein)